MSIDVLITDRTHRTVEQGLADRFRVHRLYEAPDRAGVLKYIGPAIRAVVGRAADAELIEALPRLEIVASPAVGYDGIDLEAARRRGIRVTNTPDVLNDAVAEMTLALILALVRRIPQADRFVREGRWEAGRFGLTGELTGRTAGILGLGRIGREIAARLQAMKMRVVYTGRQPKPDTPFVFYPDLVAMARECDWLVVIAPGGAETRGIVSRQVLEALGPDGHLVNMARGSLIDEDAMIELLQGGGLGGAALDVFQAEPRVPEALLTLDNVVLSPHQGSATERTRDNMGRLVVTNIERHFAGEPLLTPVF